MHIRRLAWALFYAIGWGTCLAVIVLWAIGVSRAGW